MPYSTAPDGWWREFISARPPAPRSSPSCVPTDRRTSHWAGRIGGRYMGADRADRYAERNSVPPEMVVRVTPTNIIAKINVAD